MPKVRSLIVASTGAVVALGYQGSAIAQQAPFPFTAANHTVTPTVNPAPPSATLPPFPEATATDSLATTESLPPFPEAAPSEPQQPNATANAPAARDTVIVPTTRPASPAAGSPAPTTTAIRPHTPAPMTYPTIAETAPSPVTPSQITPGPTHLAAIAPNEIHPHLLDNVAKTTKVTESAAIATTAPTPTEPIAAAPTASPNATLSNTAPANAVSPVAVSPAPEPQHQTVAVDRPQRAIATMPARPPEPTHPIAQTFQAIHGAPNVAAQTAKTPKPSQELAIAQTQNGTVTRADTVSADTTIVDAAAASLTLPQPNREAVAQTMPVTVDATTESEARSAGDVAPNDTVAASDELEMDELEINAIETAQPAAIAEPAVELPAPDVAESSVVERPAGESSEAAIADPDTLLPPQTELIIGAEEAVSGPEPATRDQFKDQKNAQALTAAAPGEQQNVPPPDFLNPSGNPMLFPTEADEVAIDITQPITLEQALALARRNNQDLQSVRLDLERAYAVLDESRAGLFPSVDGTVSLSRDNSASTEISARRQGALSSALGTDATTDTFNAELAVTYNLFDGGQVNAEINSAKLSLRFTQLEVEELTEEIHLAATQSYYALQEADQQVGIERAAVEQAQQTLRDANLLLEAGLGTRFDVIRADVDLANSQQALTQAQADQKIAQRDLVRVLGLGQQVAVTTADEIHPVEPWGLPLEETIVLAYRNRAELEQRLIEREIEEEERQIALSTQRPQVSLFATYDVLDFLDDDFDGSSGYSVGAQLTWNFFDGGASQARKRQSEVDLMQAEVAFEQERNTIRLEVEEAYFSFEANAENIKTATAAVQLAEESLRLARLRFQAGVGTQTDVIDAQTELTRARGNLLTAIITYNNSIASLRRAVSNTPDRRLFDLP
ncbi:MAG: TolC family protein [Spirulinaceae cyanobacterium]